MKRSAWRLALFGLACAGGAVAQPLRSVVVPADVPVVVAPRGAPEVLPPPQQSIRAVPSPAPAPHLPSVPSVPAGTGLAALAPAIVPLAAALLLGATAPGASGTASAPATTR